MLKLLEPFKIKDCDLEFRFAKMKPTELLSVATQLGKDELSANEKVYDYILEHTEVQTDGKWGVVKDKDFWWPQYLEERVDLVQALVIKFIGEYLTPSFTKSVK